jgi:hypothetical protein
MLIVVEMNTFEIKWRLNEAVSMDGPDHSSLLISPFFKI